MMRQRGGARGLSLVELVLVVALIAIVASAVTPAIVQRILDGRIEATHAEARLVYEAMVGRSDVPGTYGFVGDMGRLPASFTELGQAGTLPLFTTQTVRGVGMGWKGPYVNVGDSTDDYLRDGFGRPYTGASLGQVRSAGPDGIGGNADDILYPPSPPVIFGRVAVTLKMTTGNQTVVDPADYEVRVYYSNGGVEGVVVDAVAPFIFESVPMGLHAIRAVKTKNPNAGSVVASDTIASLGMGQTKLVELWF